ncbi:MAG: heavy-metal-associated domain-containing protein [Actinobacteria bacterium]|nr:heavy-metal-associated domain-containing protein [Actinomycetota bacterium]
MPNTSTYQVEGMTCSHCVHAVQTEVSAIDGVTSVDVDLTTGKVTVSSDAALDIEAVRHAVDEAGYTLIS